MADQEQRKMNYKWLITLCVQVTAGIMLYFWGDSEGKNLGLLLLGSGLGQGATGQMKAVKG